MEMGECPANFASWRLLRRKKYMHKVLHASHTVHVLQIDGDDSVKHLQLVSRLVNVVWRRSCLELCNVYPLAEPADLTTAKRFGL